MSVSIVVQTTAVMARSARLSERRRHGSVPVVLRQQDALALAHRGGLVRFGMIVAEHVKDAVHDEQRQLVVDAAAVIGRRGRGDRRAHDDVAEEHGCAVEGFAASAASSGNDSTSVGPATPMCSAFNAAISAGSTKVSVSSPLTPSARSTASARAAQRAASMSTSSCSSAQTTIGGPTPVGLGGSSTRG